MKRFAIAVAAAATLFAATANAQLATGNLQGVAQAGDTISIKEESISFQRVMKVEEAGKYQFRRFPTGTYPVNITHADGTAEKPMKIAVKVGTTARIK
jgi:hypothetical protein